jgi:hypothetical protein
MKQSTTKAPPRLPPLRIGLECGLPNLSVRDGAGWVQMPIVSVTLGLHFLKALGYEVPADTRARIAAGAIVTIEPSKLGHVPICSEGRPQ